MSLFRNVCLSAALLASVAGCAMEPASEETIDQNAEAITLSTPRETCLNKLNDLDHLAVAIMNEANAGCAANYLTYAADVFAFNNVDAYIRANCANLFTTSESWRLGSDRYTASAAATRCSAMAPCRSALATADATHDRVMGIDSSGCWDIRFVEEYRRFSTDYTAAHDTCTDPDAWMQVKAVLDSERTELKTAWEHCMSREALALRCPTGGWLDISSEVKVLGVTCKETNLHVLLHVCKSELDTPYCQAEFGVYESHKSGSSLSCDKEVDVTTVNCESAATVN